MKAPFQFKQFSIYDCDCAQKVGTDSILLGSWIKAKSPKSILDIGAGSGLLSLMLAQKYPQAKITCIEIDEKAARQCQENIDNSTFENPFEVIRGDFLKHEFVEKFDLIISNPPYFDEGVKSIVKSRKTARHDDFLPFDEFIKKSLVLLEDEGAFYMILPAEKIEKLERVLNSEPYNLSKCCFVSSFENQTSKLVLIKVSAREKTSNETLIIYEEKNVYTQAFKEMTSEYYLNF